MILFLKLSSIFFLPSVLSFFLAPFLLSSLLRRRYFFFFPASFLPLFFWVLFHPAFFFHAFFVFWFSPSCFLSCSFFIRFVVLSRPLPFVILLAAASLSFATRLCIFLSAFLPVQHYSSSVLDTCNHVFQYKFSEDNAHSGNRLRYFTDRPSARALLFFWKARGKEKITALNNPAAGRWPPLRGFIKDGDFFGEHFLVARAQMPSSLSSQRFFGF